MTSSNVAAEAITHFLYSTSTPTAAAADALATAFFLMTEAELGRFFAAANDVAAFLIGHGERDREPDLLGKPISFEKTPAADEAPAASS